MQSRRVLFRRLREALLILGVLIIMVMIGRANLRATARETATVTCLSNMRTILREAALYAAASGVTEATVGVDQLARAGIVTQRVGRCPLGGSGDNDYFVTFRHGQPVAVTCTVAPQEHMLPPLTLQDDDR